MLSIRNLLQYALLYCLVSLYAAQVPVTCSLSKGIRNSKHSAGRNSDGARATRFETIQGSPQQSVFLGKAGSWPSEVKDQAIASTALHENDERNGKRLITNLLAVGEAGGSEGHNSDGNHRAEYTSAQADERYKQKLYDWQRSGDAKLSFTDKSAEEPSTVSGGIRRTSLAEGHGNQPSVEAQPQSTIQTGDYEIDTETREAIEKPLKNAPNTYTWRVPIQLHDAEVENFLNGGAPVALNAPLGGTPALTNTTPIAGPSTPATTLPSKVESPSPSVPDQTANNVALPLNVLGDPSVALPNENAEAVKLSKAASQGSESLKLATNGQPANQTPIKDYKITITDGNTLEKDKVNDFCTDHGLCWPIWLASVILFLICAVSTVATFWMYTSYYATGYDQSKFLRQGGTWMIVVPCVGFAVGALIGGFVGKSPATSIGLGGSLMTLSLSVLMLGKCGAWLGALGGAGTGATIGVIAGVGDLYTCVGAVSGLLVGVVVGFAPLLRGLKINQKYFESSLRVTRNNVEYVTDDAHNQHSPRSESSQASSAPGSESSFQFRRSAKSSHHHGTDKRTKNPLIPFLRSETASAASQAKSLDLNSRRSRGLRKAFAGLDVLDKSKNEVGSLSQHESGSREIGSSLEVQNDTSSQPGSSRE